MENSQKASLKIVERKRKHRRSSSLPSNDEDTNKKKRRKSHNQILSGMTLAISTLQAESKGTEKTAEQSYSKVAELAKKCGAGVSGQVHRKVKCVLCTPAAIRKATQRVRKAVKKNIPLVNITWLQKCVEKGEELPFDLYLLEHVQGGAEVDPGEQNQTIGAAKDNNQTVIDDPDAGWTNPVDVGCCCVCHENGTTADCEWCTDCCKA